MEHNPFRVIKHALRTEKTTRQESGNKFAFCVDRRANKIEIKNAVEHIYRVKVADVHTSIMAGKTRRVRVRPGHTPDWKKAVVTLAAGQKISLT